MRASPARPASRSRRRQAPHRSIGRRRDRPCLTGRTGRGGRRDRRMGAAFATPGRARRIRVRRGHAPMAGAYSPAGRSADRARQLVEVGGREPAVGEAALEGLLGEATGRRAAVLLLVHAQHQQRRRRGEAAIGRTAPRGCRRSWCGRARRPCCRRACSSRGRGRDRRRGRCGRPRSRDPAACPRRSTPAASRTRCRAGTSRRPWRRASRRRRRCTERSMTRRLGGSSVSGRAYGRVAAERADDLVGAHQLPGEIAGLVVVAVGVVALHLEAGDAVAARRAAHAADAADGGQVGPHLVPGRPVVDAPGEHADALRDPWAPGPRRVGATRCCRAASPAARRWCRRSSAARAGCAPCAAPRRSSSTSLRSKVWKSPSICMRRAR